jgi:lysophosphatidate acyltransferase
VKALRNAAHRVHFVAACLVGVAAFLALSVLGILFALLGRSAARTAPHLFAHGFGAIMRGVLGWRLQVEGLARFAANEPAVIVANHQSNLDIVTFGSVYPRRTVAIGKKELRKIPLFGWFFAQTGNILLDRGDKAGSRETIAAAAERVRDERISVWMFPEGHRNQGPTLLPFKKGAFHLAIAAQAPVLVTVCQPIRSLLLARRLLVRPGPLRIVVLPPISTEGRTAADVDALIEEVRAAMQGAREALAAAAPLPFD